MNPLNSEEVRKAVIHQARRFRELFDPLIRVPLASTIAPPENILSFAEEIMLCPTEQATVTHMQRDLESARGFRIIAGDVAAAASRGDAAILIPFEKSSETPFALIAHIVILKANQAIERHPGHWLDPQKFGRKT